MNKFYKKMLFFIIVFFSTYSFAINEEWVAQLTNRYNAIVENSENKNDFDKNYLANNLTRKEAISNQIATNTIPVSYKTEIYSYFMFTNDYSRFDESYRCLLVMLLLDYDTKHPNEPAYKAGKFEITKIAGKLLIDFLPHDEPQFIDPAISYEENMKKYLDDFVAKSINTFAIQGITKQEIISIANKYNKI